MLCIKKNKCFVLRKINFNPFRPVETCRNTFQSVQICWNTFPGLPPSPPSPSYPLPLFPFLFFWGVGGGGRVGGKPPPPKTPGRGGDEVPPPPPQDFNNNNKKQNSLTLSSLCCVIYPYPLKVSLSVHSSKLHKHLWRPLNKKTKFIVAYFNIYIYIYLLYIPP